MKTELRTSNAELPTLNADSETLAQAVKRWRELGERIEAFKSRRFRRNRMTEDREGFYHPNHNRRGGPEATDTVGYRCESSGRGQVRIVNSIFGRDLTGWQKDYSTALRVLIEGEERVWRI